MDIAMVANKYMQDAAPWALKATDPDRCATVITIVVAAIRLIGALAEPFMPGFTDKVCHILALPHADIPSIFDPVAATEAGDASAAPGACGVPAGHKINKPTPLFSAITPEQVEAWRARFGGAQETTAAAGAASGGAAAVAGAGAPAAAAAGGKPAAGAKKGGKPAAGAAADLPDVARVDLRVGHIVRAWPHPSLEKLWCEEIDVGDASGPRTVASGLRAHYTQEQMTGRKVIVVCNLKPRTMGGFESKGEWWSLYLPLA